MPCAPACRPARRYRLPVRGPARAAAHPQPVGPHRRGHADHRRAARELWAWTQRHPARRRCAPTWPAHGRVRRAVVVHADTIGCMVKRLKANGRLEVVPVGTHSARFAEGAHVSDLHRRPGRVITGHGAAAEGQRARATATRSTSRASAGQHVEVRVDEPVRSDADLRALGIDVGDFVALDAAPEITAGGYVKSRHLDDKAGVAALLAAFKAVVESGVTAPVGAHLLVTIAEEVGHGASHGLDADVAEIVVGGQCGRRARAGVPRGRVNDRDARRDRAVRLPPDPHGWSRWRRAQHPGRPRRLSTTTARTRRRRSSRARDADGAGRLRRGRQATATSGPIWTGSRTSRSCWRCTCRPT